MANSPGRRGVPARERSPWRQAGSLIGRIALGGLAAASIAFLAPSRLAAQEAGAPNIRVAPTIVVEANTEAVLAIEIEPPGAGAATSFVSLRGLPPAVALRDGHAVGPGVWAVPLSALPSIEAQIPAGLPGNPSEVHISLIAMDGRLLAQARSMLVIQSAPQTSASLAPAAPAPAAEEQARAERLLARGAAYLANGNIMGARDFFERAADAGLAASALQLAATYDPAELTRMKVQGVKPDVGLARKWYERARQLGAAEAAEPLMRLGRN